ncbi:ABC transporter permease [Paralcaligenes ureilyticus]|uniref:Peptide/nickel transport system permease protein n=1 Tax=Paralcaligenes ureilyticus TaxID=627131 RepID=A0A4R3LS16_9BURK|nr:ABC transporter permease [Paralcaligenes ureilyticus]TCT03364.1 peptide/nickel transport system permease protein [Paralcaligenes ureilyticus]
MSYYIARRLFVSALLVVFVSIISFTLIFAPGDPSARLAGEGSAADTAHLMAQYGFDKPIVVQYLKWLNGIVHGNFGDSLYFHRPVSELLLQHFPITAQLGGMSMLLAVLIALPLGIAAACWKGSLVDRFALMLASFGQAMPPFCLAFLLIIFFSVQNNWLPASGFETWRHYLMPTTVLAIFATPALIRVMKSEMDAVLRSDYIRTARAMGLGSGQVVLKYAQRNALRPVVSLAAAQMGTLLAGSVIVETVFAINGAGQLAWISILRGDFPTIQALILVFSLLYILLTLLADLVNGWLDPRVRTAK